MYIIHLILSGKNRFFITSNIHIFNSQNIQYLPSFHLFLKDEKLLLYSKLY